jgi:6-phosphofructokinase 1
METTIRKIAILTSGGDAPGMNAAIRAIDRTAIARGWEAYGVMRGYRGLIAGDVRPLGVRDVGGIMNRGGTVLGSARCPEFKEEEARQEALRRLREMGIGALFVIGGNGTQQGAFALSRMGFPVVGIASTIDNDLYGSAITIGVDTALNIALEAIDRLRVTASSHQRANLVEVMGRDCGYLALMAGLAGGAEAVVLPEFEVDPEMVAHELTDAYHRGKPHAIVVVAEGARYNATGLVEYIQRHHERLGFQLRATVLGHVQRGGTPTYFDRMLGTRLGAEAVEQLAAGNHGILVGTRTATHEDLITTPLPEVVGREKPLDPKLLQLAKVLAQ